MCFTGWQLVMDITKQHLNRIFLPRGSSNQVGDMFKCIWGVFCIELACGNEQTPSITYKIPTYWDFYNLGSSLPAYRGAHIFEKRTQTEHLTIILNVSLPTHQSVAYLRPSTVCVLLAQYKPRKIEKQLLAETSWFLKIRFFRYLLVFRKCIFPEGLATELPKL